MGHFSGVNQAQVFDSGNYFPWANAKYMVEIERCIVKKSRRAGEVFICEMKVLESNNSEMPKGVSGTWLVKLDNEDTAYPNLKQFALAAMGVDTNDKEAVNEHSKNVEEALDAACGEEQAFAATKLYLETVAHTTQKKTQFTKHTFSPA